MLRGWETSAAGAGGGAVAAYLTSQTGNRRRLNSKRIQGLVVRTSAVHKGSGLKLESAHGPASEARRPDLERRHRVRQRHVMLPR